MLENKMMADKIQYCYGQVNRVQHILFVAKIVSFMFILFFFYFFNVVCLVRVGVYCNGAICSKYSKVWLSLWSWKNIPNKKKVILNDISMILS